MGTIKTKLSLMSQGSATTTASGFSVSISDSLSIETPLVNLASGSVTNSGGSDTDSSEEGDRLLSQLDPQIDRQACLDAASEIRSEFEAAPRKPSAAQTKAVSEMFRGAQRCRREQSESGELSGGRWTVSAELTDEQRLSARHQQRFRLFWSRLAASKHARVERERRRAIGLRSDSVARGALSLQHQTILGWCVRALDVAGAERRDEAGAVEADAAEHLGRLLVAHARHAEPLLDRRALYGRLR